MEKDRFGYENFVKMDPKNDIQLDYNVPELYIQNTLSFHILIDYIKKIAEATDHTKSSFAKSILDDLKKAPELMNPVTDMNLLKKHRALVDNLLMFVFPSAFWDMQTYAATTGFLDEVFYSSPKFSEIIKVEGGYVKGEMNIDIDSFNYGKIISMYIVILRFFYKFDISFEFPIVYKIPDPITGLDRYFKMNLANEFMEIIAKGKVKKLSEKDLENIKSRIYDIEYLRKMIEPQNFEFKGFLVLNAINISGTEILSAIKKDLIKKETITTTEGFLKLQHKLRSLLKSPDLLLGLADYPGNIDKLFEYGHKIGNSFILNENCTTDLPDIKNSIYDYAFSEKKVLVIEDIEKSSGKTAIERGILKQGIKNILIAPLFYNDEIVGVLELGSTKPASINKINALMLREILPLFAMSVARGKAELNSKIEETIKEKCTAIHPTLEWKFRNAAINFLKSRVSNPETEMEDIVFHDVYPLFGLADIRNSSEQRNEAIRSDLIENLELARSVFREAKKSRKMKILDEIIFEINKRVDSLKFGLSSSDESETLRFLSKKIVPHFDHLKSYSDKVKNQIEKYCFSIDPKLGFVYKRRRNFEESVSIINNMIAGFFDGEQKDIQEIFPHYFERYKTDGVDHNIYIGQSLVENLKYNRIYLKNLRLWQLVAMCVITKKSALLKSSLPIPLEIANLVLVQDAPLSIRFRFDEKKFDVDGAYNIRYEIMKKRIDKAEIKGREERLTQPGKIAIVFSDLQEAQEYLEYIEYLQSTKYLTRDVEELEIEDLQGIRGLKALRVTVDVKNVEMSDKVDTDEIKKVIKKMSVN